MQKLLLVIVLTFTFNWVQAQNEFTHVYFTFSLGNAGIGSRFNSIQFGPGDHYPEHLVKLDNEFNTKSIYHGGISFKIYKSIYIGFNYSQLLLNCNPSNSIYFSNKEITYNIQGYSLEPSIKYEYNIYPSFYITPALGISFNKLKLKTETIYELNIDRYGSNNQNSEKITPTSIQLELELKYELVQHFFVYTCIGYSYSGNNKFYIDDDYIVVSNGNLTSMFVEWQKHVDISLNYFKYFTGIQFSLTLY